MVKKILYLIFASFLLTTPQMKADDWFRTATEQEVKEITISVTDAAIYIKNAEHLIVEIYNMTGVRVANYRIESNSQRIDLYHLVKGCYIVKVGKVARKVYLR